MSFGRFPGFEDDPFFSRDRPFSMGFPSFPMLGFPDHRQHDPREQQRGRERRPDRQMSLMDPFSMFNNMDRMMSDAFKQQEQMFQQMQRHHSVPSASGGPFFSSSSVMHYSSAPDKDGNPQVYHTTSSVTQGPGGVKETRKSEADSRRGTKKMSIGHHIGDRSHTIEKKQDLRTKDMEQHQEFINIDESDAGSFDQEFKTKTKQFARHQPSVRSDYAHRRGLGGGSGGGEELPDISVPGPSSTRQHRDHRSRSPERRRGGHLPSYAESEAERRREYLKEKPGRHARF